MSKTSKQIALFILLGVTTGLILGWTSNSKVQLWIQELTSPLNKGRADVALGYADTVEKVLPAVVRIYRISFDTSANPALLDDPHYQQFITGELVAEQGTVYGLGSGVIISTRGHILTNHHVIAGADQLEVKLNDNRSAIAQIIGVDPETDLALLKIDLPDLQPALIPQQDKSRPGDIVLAIGNPHGLGTSVSMGIISALGRNQLGLNTFENFIQTDAPINSGNSGGPLINTSGQLIGINTAHFYNTGTSTRSQGLGLAIPISTANQVANSLLKDGKVIRGWLGITIDLISQQMSGSLLQHSEQEQIRVSGVYVGSPAHKAGLQQDDIITAFDGRNVTSARAAMDYIAELTPGTSLNITFQRQGQGQTVAVMLGVRPLSQ